jgi:NDP-sugar pyrophosphorylase family protein
VEDCSRYGSILIENGRVTRWAEKQTSGQGWINGGWYVFDPAISQLPVPSGAWSLEEQIFSNPQTYAIQAFESCADFCDIGTPEDYTLAQTLIPQWVKKHENCP